MLLYEPAGYIGNFRRDKTVYLWWSSFNADGESVVYSGSPTFAVYKDNDDVQTEVGVSETMSFDSVVGVNLIAVDCSADDFYTNETEFNVMMQGATIATKTVSGIIGSFSLNNRAT